MFFEFLTTAATVVLAFATWHMAVQTKKLAKETRNANLGNFLLTLQRDFFFNKDLYKVRDSIETRTLKFKDVQKDKESHFQDRKGYDIEDERVDDYIGFFETINDLITRDILQKEDIKNTFATYILDAYYEDKKSKHVYNDGKEFRYKPIYDYINLLRDKYKNKYLYAGFETLAKFLF